MSTNKTLLKEHTVRRFMKLAEITPLTENFVEKIYEQEPPEGEAPEGLEGEAPEAPEAPEGLEGEAPEGLEGEAPEGLEGEEESDAIGALPDDVKAEVTEKLVDAIGEIMGVDVEVSAGEEGLPGEELGGEELGGGLPGAEAGMPGEEGGEAEEEAILQEMLNQLEEDDYGSLMEFEVDYDAAPDVDPEYGEGDDYVPGEGASDDGDIDDDAGLEGPPPGNRDEDLLHGGLYEEDELFEDDWDQDPEMMAEDLYEDELYEHLKRKRAARVRKRKTKKAKLSEQITARVMARVRKEQQKKKRSEVVADRVIKRLFK